MHEYIERRSLLLHIKDLPTWWADAGGVYGRSMKYPEGMFDCEDVVNSIENAPSVEVAPVMHGRWVCVDTDTEQFFLCNRCKKKEYWESNYCPNCGCRMDG